MAPTLLCPSCLSAASRSALLNSRRTIAMSPSLLLPTYQVRTAVQSTNAAKYKRKDQPTSQQKKKNASHYLAPDLKNALQFPLVDAMRYIRAAEVGRNPTSVKYELHVRLRTPKNGAVVRNRMHLPYPVKTDVRVCAICPPDSSQAKAALAAGAAVVGEEEIFEQVKAGKINFDACLCYVDSFPKLVKAGVAKILGPKGLMPSAKRGSVVKDVATAVRGMVGGSEYRERAGVVRVAIAQLGFTPEQVMRNIRAFMDSMKKDMVRIQDQTSKEIHEVVLSSTHGPGLSLNGEFVGPNSIPVKDLAVN